MPILNIDLKAQCIPPNPATVFVERDDSKKVFL